MMAMTTSSSIRVKAFRFMAPILLVVQAETVVA
jgi:hypothetical protein